MASDPLLPETKVLAVASHVVYGYVGNKMATFCMQALGCDVSALNTVHFSNHTGYRQVKGTKSSAEEIRDIFEGLKQSHLVDFDMMLSGYAPGAEAVNAVGAIARDLKFRKTMKPGSFFWVLDPVMGDQGRLYVNEDVVPAYKALLADADLILPNQFEAELLSETKITSYSTLHNALAELHTTHRVPHVVITSVRLPAPSPPSSSSTNPTSPQHLPSSPFAKPLLSVVGSSRTSTGAPRPFVVTVPDLDCFFSGTGDMFAALLVARLRAAVASFEPACAGKASWLPADEVGATELPLAKAVEQVLGSMHEILVKTKAECDAEMQAWEGSVHGRRVSSSHGGEVVGREIGRTADKGKADEEAVGEEGEDRSGEVEFAQKQRWLRKTRAAEVRVVRNVGLLRGEGVQTKFTAEELRL